MKQSTMGIVSLILSIVSMLALGILFGPAALITGIIGVREENTAKGCAIAGIVIGAIATLLCGLNIMAASSRMMRF